MTRHVPFPFELSVHAKNIFDKEVIGRAGTNIGKVEDLLIDTNNWRVTALQVRLEGQIAEEFGMKKRFGSTQIALSVEYVQGASDKIVLTMGVEELLKLVASQAPSPHASDQEHLSPPVKASQSNTTTDS
jgi:sporulation protein YlmC with PRC-barrel domain